jgi:hypothetical protein
MPSTFERQRAFHREAFHRKASHREASSCVRDRKASHRAAYRACGVGNCVPSSPSVPSDSKRSSAAAPAFDHPAAPRRAARPSGRTREAPRVRDERPSSPAMRTCRSALFIAIDRARVAFLSGCETAPEEHRDGCLAASQIDAPPRVRAACRARSCTARFRLETFEWPRWFRGTATPSLGGTCVPR